MELFYAKDYHSKVTLVLHVRYIYLYICVCVFTWNVCVCRLSPLHHAALSGNKELISLLLEAQSAVDIKDHKGKDTQQRLMERHCCYCEAGAKIKTASPCVTNNTLLCNKR